MANPKCRLLRILSAVYAVLLLLTLGLRVGSRALERREKINQFQYEDNLEVSEYQRGIPVEEINYDTIAFQYFTYLLGGAEQPPVPNLVMLPFDLPYYQEENGEKQAAYTIPKGTAIYWNLWPRQSIVPEGYGRISYPTYEKGWRWVRPFLTAEGEEIPENFMREISAEKERELEASPYYYVKLKDLWAVEQEAYNQHEQIRRNYFDPSSFFSGGKMETNEAIEDRFYGLLTYTDEILFRGGWYGTYGKGVYCSPDIGPLVWRSEDTVYAVLLAVTAFLAVVVFRRKPERKNEAGGQV